jgi:biopolymer transport protein ExbB
MITTAARFLTDGGSFMWLILGVLAFAAAVILERIHFYHVTCRQSAADQVRQSLKAIQAGRPDRALKELESRPSPLNAILTVALERYRGGFAFGEIRQAVEEVAVVQVPRLGRRVGYLAMAANVATLAGLLGTIFGLQASFSSLAVAEAAEKAALLAAGISQAMNTTAFGLMVAIPCMIAHARLTSTQTRLTDELDAGTLYFMNHLEARLVGRAGRETEVAATAAVGETVG